MSARRIHPPPTPPVTPRTPCSIFAGETPTMPPMALAVGRCTVVAQLRGVLLAGLWIDVPAGVGRAVRVELRGNQGPGGTGRPSAPGRP